MFQLRDATWSSETEAFALVILISKWSIIGFETPVFLTKYFACQYFCLSIIYATWLRPFGHNFILEFRRKLITIIS